MKQRNPSGSGRSISSSSKPSETMLITRRRSSSLYCLFTFFLFLHSLITQISADVSNSTEFIRTSCNDDTLYPDICYSSLSSYASKVHHDPGQLAQIAISVTLTKAQDMAAFISNLTHNHPYSTVYNDDSHVAGAVDDCASNVDDAIDEIRGSLKQMRQLRSGPDPTSQKQGSFRFQMSNVQTWMSAALTDEETCTDGFEDVPDGGVKADVCGRAAELKKLTSNALALVNSYVNKQL